MTPAHFKNPAALLIPGLIIACLAGCNSNNNHLSRPPGIDARDVARNTETARSCTNDAYDLINQKKYDQAQVLLRKAIEADPMYGQARNDMGIIDFHLNNLYDAAWEFQNAIKLMPGRPEPHYNLGLVMEKAGGVHLSDALQSYTEATQLDPQNAEYLDKLARLRVRLDMKDDETRRVLQEVIMRSNSKDRQDWARFTLIRFRASQSDTTQPATAPAE